jgi:SAM-dependent methyltransferase
VTTAKSSSTDSQLYCPQCKKPLAAKADSYKCQDCLRSYQVTAGIPQLIYQKTPPDSFDARFFEFLYEMEQKHFWHVGRREIILEVFKSLPNIEKARVLEIGCGNGSVLTFLKSHGLNIDGGDIFQEGLEFCRQRDGAVLLYRIDILALPFVSSYDFIGLFDVLEHIEDDEKALREVGQALKTGGKVLITIPAHRFLWSYIDEASNHQRRYSRKEILIKLERNGFIIKKATFYISLLFPLFLAARIIDKLLPRKRRPDVQNSFELKTIPLVNGLLLWMLRVEKWLIRHVNLPLGASLLILAEKK